MFKVFALSTALVGVGIVGVAAIPSEAAPGDLAAQGWRARMADTPLGRMIMGRMGRAMVLRSELNVTPEQKTKIRAILKEHRSDIAKAVEPMVDSRRKLREAVIAGKDDAAIRAAAAELGKEIGDAAVAAKPLVEKLRGVMNSEQLKMIEEFRAENAVATDKFFERLAQ